MRIVYIIILFASFSCRKEVKPLGQEMDSKIEELLKLKNANTSSQSMSLDHRILNLLFNERIDQNLKGDIEKVLRLHDLKERVLNKCDIIDISKFDQLGYTDNCLRVFIMTQTGKIDFFNVIKKIDTTEIMFFSTIINNEDSLDISLKVNVQKDNKLVPEINDVISYYLLSVEHKNGFDQKNYAFTEPYVILQTYFMPEKNGSAFYNELFIHHSKDFDSLINSLYEIVKLNNHEIKSQ